MMRHLDVVGIVASIVFVILWSTGFVGAKATMGHAEPYWLLFLRFVASAALLSLVVLALGRPWPKSLRAVLHLSVAGLLIHAIYLGGVFTAIKTGLQANATSIIVSVQPLLTAFVAVPVLGERLSARKLAGLVLGALGVLLTVSGNLAAGLGTPVSLIFAFAALAGISCGTIYQKRFCSDLPMLSGLVVQFIAAALVCLALALVFEERRVEWTFELIFGFVWLVLVLSCAAVLLLYFLIKRGAATNVASLFFLVPGSASLFAWLLYGESFGAGTIGGLVLVSLAVLLVNWRAPAPRAAAPNPPA